MAIEDLDVKDSSSEKKLGPLKEKPIWMTFVTVILAGVIAYRLIFLGGLDQTAALFIGLPAVLAYALVWSNPSGGIYFRYIVGMTFFLLLTAVVFGEGTICLLFIAPIAYVVGLGFLWLYLRVQADKKKSNQHILRVVVVLPFALASLEGVLPVSSASRDQSVHMQHDFNVSTNQLRHQLASTMEFDRQWSWILQMGFPLPVHSEGHGLQNGDETRVFFASPEGPGGMQTWRLVRSEPNNFRWVLIADSTVMVRWARWTSIEITMQELSPTQSRVRMQLDWTRTVEPGWYFSGLQTLAVQGVAQEMFQILERSPQ